jgi:glycosyltransferase involved in cell wall biosynthesis
MKNYLQNTITLVVPCYNEASRFDEIYWNAILESCPDIYWLFINDGSTDKTQEILEKLAVKFPNINILNLKFNSGKAEAIRLGFKQILINKNKSFFYGFIDADGSISKQDFLEIINFAQKIDHLSNEWDVLISSRIKLPGHTIKRSKIRHVIGRIYRQFILFYWKGIPYDTQCGFKLFCESNAFRESLNDKFITRWFVDIELFSRISNYAMRPVTIMEIPLKNWEARNGSKLTFKQKILSLVELIKICRIISHNTYLNNRKMW